MSRSVVSLHSAPKSIHCNGMQNMIDTLLEVLGLKLQPVPVVAEE